jgi:hypothetical protein
MGFGWGDIANIATGGAYNQIGSSTGWWDPASDWTNDFNDFITPGSGRVTQALSDWQDTGDWAETLNTLTDAPLGGVTGVSNMLGEYTVPSEVRDYAPAIGGAIGSYVGGPVVASIGAGIGSDIAGKPAKEKYKDAGIAFGGSYAMQGLSGGGWDVTSTPAYDTTGIETGEYATGDIDKGAQYDWEKGEYVKPGEPYSEQYVAQTPEEYYGTLRTDTMTPGEYYGDIVPATGSAGLATSADFMDTPSETDLWNESNNPIGYYGPSETTWYDSMFGNGSTYGEGGTVTKSGSLLGKAMPYVMGAGLVSNTISSYKQKKAEEEAAKQYLAAAAAAKEEGTWNDTTRANYMKGVSGSISDMVSGLKRRISSNAAASGRGGGFYGKNVDKAQQQGRELYAKELANTYTPNYIAPANYSAYLAAQGGDWYDSLLTGLGSTAGKYPMLAYALNG